MEKYLLKKSSSITFIVLGGLLSIGSILYLLFLSMLGFMVAFIKPYLFFGLILCFFSGVLFIKIGTKNARKLIDSKLPAAISAFFRWILATPFLFLSLLSAIRYGYGIFYNKATNENAYAFITLLLLSSWILWPEIRELMKKFSKTQTGKLKTPTPHSNGTLDGSP